MFRQRDSQPPSDWPSRRACSCNFDAQPRQVNCGKLAASGTVLQLACGVCCLLVLRVHVHAQASTGSIRRDSCIHSMLQASGES